MLTPDQGYFFGMGAFETVAVEEGNPVLLEKHYERLFRAVDFLHLELSKKELEEKTFDDIVERGKNRWGTFGICSTIKVFCYSSPST